MPTNKIASDGGNIVEKDADGNVAVAGNVTATGSFIIGSASMDETDLEKLDGITNGTQAAGKCVVADSNVNTGVAKVTGLHIGTSGSETEVTATPAEINLLDTAVAGTVVNSKAVIYSADGDIAAGSVASDANVTGNNTSYASSAKLVYKKILNYDDDLTGNIILFDANAIIWSIKVNVITGWNSDSADKFDIGVTASAAAYQNDLDIQATGWSITTAPTVGVKPGATYVTYTIVNQGEPVANQGVLEIYIEYSLY